MPCEYLSLDTMEKWIVCKCCKTGIHHFFCSSRGLFSSVIYSSVFSLQLVSSSVMRCWTVTPQRCLCGSWLCRAPPASVCSGMKSSTSTRLQKICLWTSEGKGIYIWEDAHEEKNCFYSVKPFVLHKIPNTHRLQWRFDDFLSLIFLSVEYIWILDH